MNAALAAAIVEGGQPLPTLGSDAQALALAWALKDHGYAAWSRSPAVAARTSAVLRELRSTVRLAPPAATELDAIATWMDGIALLTQGRMSEAAKAFDAAAASFRQVGSRVQAARTQVPKIMALSVLGLHDEAADCGEAALAELRELGDTESAARVSLNLGNLHRRRNDFARAIEGFRAAAVMAARLGDHERSIMADIGLADARASLGEIDAARHMFTRAATRARQHGFPVLEALAEETAALVDLARGRNAQALAGFETARRRYESLAMPQHLAIAGKQLADAYLELRLLPEAARGFEQAMQRFEALEMPVESAWTLLQQGRTLALAGEPDAAVEAALTKAAALFAAQKLPSGLATVTLARAERLLMRGDAAQAVDRAAEASAHFTEAGLVEGRARADAARADALFAGGRLDEAQALLAQVLAAAREHGLQAVTLRAETLRGQLALAAGRDTEARDAFESAIATLEAQREALPADDLRHAFQAGHLRPYRELLRLALHDGDARAVLPALERFRARALGERLARRLSPRAEASQDPATDDRRTQLRWLDHRLRKLREEGADSARLADEVRRAEHALLEHVRRQRLASPAADSHAPASALDVEALQAALREDEALVEFGRLDDELFACVVTGDATRVVRRLAAWPEVEAAIRDARFQIETLRQGAQRLERHLDQLMRRLAPRLERLHALLWAPLEAALAGRDRVVVVGFGPLVSLPWSALHDGPAIALAPSAGIALDGLRRRAIPADSVLALGETGTLQHAGEEARFVAGLFGCSQVLAGDEASVARFTAGAPGFDVLHLACHARFRADNPMFSALQLVDGPLTVEATERLDLAAGIVTLSACETGLTDDGDEMTGLVRGFLVAGARRVVASLWPVDDATTREFMAHFYRALQGGALPVMALRSAQAEVRRLHPHPFHWAAFVLHGGF